jgi:uncharacterized membrane protein HdeD (DUF308 family)
MRDDALSRNWWAILTRGLVAIAFAAVAWARPGLTLAILIIFFAAYVIEDGILSIVAAVRAARREERWWPMALEGVLGVALGLFAIIMPTKAISVALVVVAVWALASGALELVAAVRLRRAIAGEWLLALSGLVRLAFGVLLLARPGAGLWALLWLTAGYALVDGLVLIALSLRLKRYAERPQAGAGGMTPQPA